MHVREVLRVHGRVPGRDVEILGQVPARRAGAVDHDVHGAELGLRLVDHPLRGVAVAQVGDDPGSGQDRGRRAPKVLLAARRDGDPRPLLDEGVGAGEPDALAAPRDEDDFFLQSQLHARSLTCGAQCLTSTCSEPQLLFPRPEHGGDLLFETREGVGEATNPCRDVGARGRVRQPDEPRRVKRDARDDGDAGRLDEVLAQRQVIGDDGPLWRSPAHVGGHVREGVERPLRLHAGDSGDGPQRGSCIGAAEPCPARAGEHGA